MEGAKKRLSYKEAKLKIASFCAYQERYQQEVRDKLYSYGLHSEDVENLISYLITEKYLNELRFSKAYAGGKFRIKKWGKVKIRLELKRRKLSDFCINKGLEEIDPEDYLETLHQLLKSKQEKIEAQSAFELHTKMAKFVINKGYESDLVWQEIKNMPGQ